MEAIGKKRDIGTLLSLLILCGAGVSIMVDPSKIWAETWRDFITVVTVLVMLFVITLNSYTQVKSSLLGGWHKTRVCAILAINVLAMLCTIIIIAKFLIEKMN